MISVVVGANPTLHVAWTVAPTWLDVGVSTVPSVIVGTGSEHIVAADKSLSKQ